MAPFAPGTYLLSHPKLLAVPTRPITLYAGTDFDGVWKSVDGGFSWARAGTTLPGSMVDFNIAVDPLQPGTLFAGLAGGVAFSIGAVFRSRDSGATWQQADTGIPRSSERSSYPSGVFALALNPSRPTELAAGTILQGAFRSTDGGDSWSAINQGVPFRTGSTDWRVEAEALAFDPHHKDQLRGLFAGKLYRFDTGTWVRHSTSNLQLGFLSSRLYFHPGRPGLLFAAGGSLSTSEDGGSVWTIGGSIYRSVDGGGSWQKKLSEIGFVRSLVRDPRDSRVIYAGTEGSGVLRSTDSGETWSDFTGAIFYPLIYSLAIAVSDPPALIAGSYGSGLYGTRLSEGGEPCTGDDTSLCLLGNRFQVTARYIDYSGGSGIGKAVSMTPDTGSFWFFTPSNVEAVIKMVPFCENGRDDVAVDAAGLTDLGVTFTVTDTATGQSEAYANPLGTPFKLIRDGPFTCMPSGTATAAEETGFVTTSGTVMPSPAPVEPLAVCTPDATALCPVNGRFRVTARYRDYSGQAGTGQAVSLTSDTGYFWFFSASNVEVVQKLVNSCGTESNVNAVYANGLTDLGVEIEVTDTASGLTERYSNPLGSDFELIRDGPFSCP